MTDTAEILARSDRGFITQVDIQDAIQAYTAMLPHPEMLYQKSITFERLIRHIYNTVIKTIIPKGKTDYSLLNDLFFQVYIPLCGMYGYQPNILLFTNLTGVKHDLISKTLVNSQTGKLTQVDRDYIQNWHDACEAGLYGSVSNHASIGAMFLLKAVYGYQETQAIRIETDAAAPALDLKQITGALTNEAPELPGPPQDDII